jgi:hypothetical protein
MGRLPGINKKNLLLCRVIPKWALSSLLGSLVVKTRPIHVLFCVVDHFEPGTAGALADEEDVKMKELLREYPKLADKHTDYYGNRPKRTWFFPPHYHRRNNLQRLVSLCSKGYGEIELHLHHGKTRPDTAENLEKTIVRCVEEYREFGIFGTENGECRYGFIHGDWALNNSLAGRFCGVDNEIEILERTGCYADFTLPSPEAEVNPRQINSVFYASTDTRGPKAYSKGPSVRVHGRANGGLMIVQGPLFPFFAFRGIAGIRYAADQLSHFYPVSTRRMDGWIKAGIHVTGKRSWVIVKLHTHGAADSAVVLGDGMDRILSYLESRYNDGARFRLHYVTARELYNIIKSAEAGRQGEDPEEFRNSVVAAPSYRSDRDIPEASETLKTLVAATYSG